MSLAAHSERRIVSQTTLHNLPQKDVAMSVMWSLAVCKAQEGMCRHEKVMLSVARASDWRCGRLPAPRLTGTFEQAIVRTALLGVMVNYCAASPGKKLRSSILL